MSAVLPVETFLLVADVLDRLAHHALDLVVGDRCGTAGLAPSSLLCRAATLNALRDVGRLRMQQNLHIRLLPVKTVLLVADVLDRGAHHAFDLLVGDRFRTAGFAGDHDLVGGSKRLAGGADRPGVDAGLRAFTEKQIDDLIGNPVADLVRMSWPSETDSLVNR